mgnify:CR=1 FL=1
MPKNRRKDYRGYENDNFIVIDDTGKTTADGHTQILLVLNKHTGEYEERNANSVVYGGVTGVPYREAQHARGFDGVHWSKSKRMFEATIGIENKRYYLGQFSTRPLGLMAYKTALNNWMNHGKKPCKVDTAQRNSTTGEKYIQWSEAEQRYRFKAVRNGKQTMKRFKTIIEARRFKQQFLGGN